MLKFGEKKEFTVYDEVLAIQQLCKDYKILWEKVKEHLPQLLDDRNIFKLRKMVED
jgi:hypothetical protein